MADETTAAATDGRGCQPDGRRRCGCHRRHAEAADQAGRAVRLLEPQTPTMAGR